MIKMIKMINKMSKYALVFVVLMSFSIAQAQDAKVKEVKGVAEQVKGKTENKTPRHSYKKWDKDSPEYKKYLKQQVEKQEKYKKSVKEFEETDSFNKALLTQNLDFDVNIGDPKAPITIVEYSSLSCGHCKHFYETTYSKIKKNFIDTGKVYFKYRHYPLNGAAVKGALVVSCASDDAKEAVLAGLFKGQAQWAYSKSEAQLIDRLQTAALIAGLGKQQFQKCYDDEKSQDRMLELMKQANKELNVDATPTLFIDGSTYLGGRGYDTMKIYLDKLLEEKTK